jgi:alanine dehydrogenase
MIYDSSRRASFIARELLQKAKKQGTPVVIGIPREDWEYEKRVPLTPEAVSLLVKSGYRVLLETGAGLTINCIDEYYTESGAEIANSTEEVFGADLILKILPPTLEEVAMMRPRATVFSFLHIRKLSLPLLELMSEKKINALAYELFCDDMGLSPFVTAISEIEGTYSITLAAELLSNVGILLGGVPGVSPTEIVVIGAGTAGAMAARTALAMGASVKVFDDDVAKLRAIRHEPGSLMFTSTFQPNVLRDVFRSADVVIGAMQYINTTHYYRISCDLTRELKQGAIIIDVRMEQGGCFETTMEACMPGHPTVYERFGLLYVCEMSLSSRVARTAAISLSNIFVSMLSVMADCGGLSHFARFDRGFSAGFYLYAGKMVNSYVGNHFNIPVTDIGLFLPGGY